MTLQEWRSHKDLVEWARTTFARGEWSLLLSVLDEMHPRKDRLPPVASDSVKSTRLGEIYGYDVALEHIQQLAVSPQTRTVVEPDFGAEEIIRQNAPLTKPPEADK